MKKINLDSKQSENILSFRGETYESSALLSGQYAHYVDDYIVYQAHGDKTIRRAKKKKDGKYIKCDEVILSNSHAINNFRIIKNNSLIYNNYKYIAVGGVHYKSSDCQPNKETEDIIVPDPTWPNIERRVMKDNFFHPQHANGLYIFFSNDMKTWKHLNDKPIHSVLTRCIDVPVGALGHDYMPSLVYNEKTKEFLLYIRANLKLGVRHSMVSKSKDLIKWSNPKLIDLVDMNFDYEHDNFYYFEVFPYKSRNYNFLSFVPYFRNDVIDSNGTRKYYDEKNLIFKSVDGVSWESHAELIFKNRGSEHPSGHMTFPHILSALEEDNSIKLFVHEKFLTLKNNMKIYSIKKRELNE